MLAAAIGAARSRSARPRRAADRAAPLAPAPAARPPAAAPAPSSDDPTDLRARFGVERAAHLLRSSDADERLRGVERAAALGTPEALAVLVQQLEPGAATRGDARAKIAIARGLAAHVDQPAARAALLVIVGLPAPRPSPQRAETDEPSYAPRIELARRIAALALAGSGEAHAVDSLVAIAHGSTPGTEAAVAALAAYPPSGSATWAKPMSAAIAKLVARTGDLRALGALLDAAKGVDVPTRAAAIEALGALGDPRVIEIATAALEHEDPRVRTAAAAALVALGAPDAAARGGALLADDATAGARDRAGDGGARARGSCTRSRRGRRRRRISGSGRRRWRRSGAIRRPTGSKRSRRS